MDEIIVGVSHGTGVIVVTDVRNGKVGYGTGVAVVTPIVVTPGI
jgi:hypothetical protein